MDAERKRIFVFGSNLAGVHGAGSALHARHAHGAQLGVGNGPTGNAYAIPTKDHNVYDTLPLDVIARFVVQFIRYAESRPAFVFDVVAIGCGLAGYTPAQIAPLFKGAPPNVNLPAGWRDLAARAVSPDAQGDEWMATHWSCLIHGVREKLCCDDAIPFTPATAAPDRSPRAAAPRLVHNHGIDPSCRERIVDGQLVGECIAPIPAPRAAEGEASAPTCVTCDGTGQYRFGVVGASWIKPCPECSALPDAGERETEPLTVRERELIDRLDKERQRADDWMGRFDALSHTAADAEAERDALREAIRAADGKKWVNGLLVGFGRARWDALVALAAVSPRDRAEGGR